MSRKIIYSLLTIIILFFAYVMVGYMAPDFYEGEVTEYFLDRRVDIWKNLVSVEVIPLRRKDVESIVVFGDDIEGIVWRENLKNGNTRFLRVIERHTPERFVIERFKSDNGVTGVWEFNLREVGDKTEITIHEKSLNKNLWLRAYYTVMGRNILLRREVKSLRVSLFQRLITTP